MAVTAYKTFIAGEVLTAADLNSSYAQVFDNGQDLGWPATKAKDLDGYELVLDSDSDTSITVDTDDQIDFKIGGSDLVVMSATKNTVENPFFIKEMASALSDVASYGQLWVKNAAPNQLWFTDDTGVDTHLSATPDQAVQADIEAETNENTYIPPDLIKHAPGFAKVWVHFDASTGTPLITDSYGVSSLTDNGVGLTTINFDANFSALGSQCPVGNHDSHNNGSQATKFTSYAVGSVQVQTIEENPADTGSFVDSTDVTVAIFGDF